MLQTISVTIMQCVIRESGERDRPAVRACVAALQEFERVLDPALPPGEAMADAYSEQMYARCANDDGQVFVADRCGEIVGFVTVFARCPYTAPDDPPGTFALVSDLVVLPPHRGGGVGRRLLERAEAFARARGARELRVEVLAANEPARRLYTAAGFSLHLEVLAKRW